MQSTYHHALPPKRRISLTSTFYVHNIHRPSPQLANLLRVNYEQFAVSIHGVLKPELIEIFVYWPVDRDSCKRTIVILPYYSPVPSGFANLTRPLKTRVFHGYFHQWQLRE